MDELKEHLEKQFECWMNWKNYGKYDSKVWIENDSSTWTWQIDHIIPQSTFKYTSMENEEFKKCWELNNLRPLSSKQNFMDGVLRVRHEKIPADDAKIPANVFLNILLLPAGTN